MKSILNDPKVERLITLVEESTRSSKEGVKRFIEPAQGTLSRAVSKRHHIIFGRRGSGKSSLLRKAAADLTVDRRPIAYVDLEIFKGHTYPDVLISILVSTLKEFEQWLNTAAVNPANKTSFWQKLFGTKPARPAYRRTDVNSLAADIHTRIDDLKAELYSSDAVPTKTVTKRAQEHSEETAIQGEAKLHVASIAAKTADTSKIEDQQEIQREYQHSKIEFLHQHILEYQELFRRLQEICGGDSYLFLDDLYHIRTTDQPYVVDYFHRIAKGSGLWLKVGTIRHDRRCATQGGPPIGVKLGDDADSIDLNLTLEKYSLTKEFLSKILRSFSQDCGIEVSDILNEGAIDRLVLASGGVARDFLAIFRKAVTVARERGDDSRGTKLPPGEVLRRLDRMVAGMTAAPFATCISTVIDPAGSSCVIAQAGHLPPVLVLPGGVTRVLDLPPGLPLGLGAESFDATQISLPPGATLALYTDGLGESRTRPIDDGLTALRHALSSALADPRITLGDACETVTQTLRQYGEDDITLVLARIRQ